MDCRLGVAVTTLLVSSSLGFLYACYAGQPVVKRPQPVNLTPAYTAYINRLRAKVQNVWSYPDGKNQVVLKATVGSDGSVSETVLRSTPTNPDAEQAANTAFAQAQPLESLPDGSPPLVQVTLTFDSFSDPHGDSKASLWGKLDPLQSPESQSINTQDQAH